jgi:hypothetical protein
MQRWILAVSMLLIPVFGGTAIGFDHIVTLLAGDFDVDGVVDVADLADWTQGFLFQSGGPANHAEGDADGDQLVAGSDFLWWQRQYDARLPSSETSPVPEPDALALLAWTGLTTVAMIPRRELNRQSRRPIPSCVAQ